MMSEGTLTSTFVMPYTTSAPLNSGRDSVWNNTPSVASAVDAVQAAVDIQRTLGQHNRDRGVDDRIVVRIGIHTGHVVTMDGDVLGNSVNLAARIQPMADPGGICISEDTTGS